MAAQTPLKQTGQASSIEGASISLPAGFEIHGVTSKLLSKQPSTTPAPPLLVLDNFKGTFAGQGFNTIFRPRNSVTPTAFPVTVPDGGPTKPPDNVLELNLTTETLAFADALGSVPNRGLFKQGDIFLSGVPYVQTIQDVTNPASGRGDGPPTGIHFEPGLWMRVPASTVNPVQVESLNRMASIPHGTTINAQGKAPITATPNPGGVLVIPPTSITPFKTSDNTPIPFDSQQLKLVNTARLPQNLSSFDKAGTITQAILDDPNTVLRNANIGKNLVKTSVISITTNKTAPQIGGGTANIDFLAGATQSAANALAVQMDATFWISEVSHQITVPVHTLGQGPIEIAAPSPVAKAPPGFQAPSFIVDPPVGITKPTTITVTSTQIQYSQKVILNFAPLSWPHVSVATLIPKDPIPVPNSVFS